MKPYYKRSKIKGVSLLLIGVLLLLVSCSRKLHFSPSPVVPIAEGYVKLKKDKNKNYSIEVKTTNLAQPDKLQPPANTYVVWMETEENGVKNIGQMESSSGLLSKALKASLHTVTPFKPVRFFITAEENADITYPGMRTVLETNRR